MRKIQALILSPMDEASRGIREVVRDSLMNLGVIPVNVEETVQIGSQWDSAVTDAIQEVDFIVADVSNKSPDVLYELGFAHALRKPTLLILSTDSEGKLMADLAAYQIATYDPKDLSSLTNQISRFVRFQESRMGEANA